MPADHGGDRHQGRHLDFGAHPTNETMAAFGRPLSLWGGFGRRSGKRGASAIPNNDCCNATYIDKQ
jgi:hypothetical protein